MSYMLVPPQGSDQADEWVRLGYNAQAEASGIINDEPKRQTKLAEAQRHYNQALRLDPRHFVATHNLAIVFVQAGHVLEALLTIERASLFEPKRAICRTTWALIAQQAEQIGLALEKAREALAMTPDEPHAIFAMANLCATAGIPGEGLPLHERIMAKEPKHPTAAMSLCFNQTLCDVTPADMLAARQKWWNAFHYEGSKQRCNNDRNCERPLRVGYVGGDFKQHSASSIFRRVLWHHTPAVEMYLYSNLPVNTQADWVGRHFQAVAGERFRDISGMPDDADVERLVRKDKIDILVDLAAHTAGTRLALFTRKPAPVQVTAWGFAHGTGCPEIDYFFADPVAIPPDEHQFYAEKIWNLPCVVTFEQPGTHAADGEPAEYQLKGTSLPPIRKNGYLTLGAYARYEKMSDECIRTFGKILEKIPDARLELKDAAYHRPYSIRRVLGLMPQIEPERLLFSLQTTQPDHMLTYQQADIILDLWPHTGGVVGIEQLWMGVPVVTLYGKRCGSRTTSSVLTAMGRSDWIAKTPDEYVDIVCRLSEDTKTLAAARKTLRDELIKSPVITGYVEAVEQAYREMFKIWAES